MHQKIRFEYEPGKFADGQLISNLLIQFVDSDHARDIKTRKSMTCIIVALLGVIVHWHMGKQTSIAAHSNDAEKYEHSTLPHYSMDIFVVLQNTYKFQCKVVQLTSMKIISLQ